MTTKTMKPALKRIGRGQVQVVARLSDYNPQHVQDSKGQVQVIPVHSLFAFQASEFSEIDETDVWEFRVPQQTEGGVIDTLLYLCGEDIFHVSAASKVAI